MSKLMKSSEENIAFYDKNADKLNEQYNSDTTEGFHQSWLEILAQVPDGANVLDIGAGNGRDAAFFESKGFNVTAIEPSEGLAKHGKKLTKNTVWLNDTLPLLPELNKRNQRLTDTMKDIVNRTIINDMESICGSKRTNPDSIIEERRNAFLKDYRLDMSGEIAPINETDRATPYSFTPEDEFSITKHSFNEDTESFEFKYKLPASFDRSLQFDFVLCSGVWMHVRVDDQLKAFSSIVQHTKNGGIFVILLRHGPFTDGRTTSQPTLERLVYLAEQAGVTPILAKASDDKLRRSEVSWSVIAFRK